MASNDAVRHFVRRKPMTSGDPRPLETLCGLPAERRPQRQREADVTCSRCREEFERIRALFPTDTQLTRTNIFPIVHRGLGREEDR